LEGKVGRNVKEARAQRTQSTSMSSRALLRGAAIGTTEDGYDVQWG